MIAPIFASAAIAMVFGIVALTVLGAENLIAHPWVDSVFWSILGAGVAVSALQALFGCWICRIDEGYLQALCREEVCR
jgi:uncharacterized membrane protein